MSELEIHELWAGYGDIPVLKDFNMHVDRGEVVALVGANGAGKSTLLHTISGLIRPDKGQITFKNQRIEHMMPHQVVEMGFIQVPEGKQLFSQMTVEENLIVGSFNRRARGPGKIPQGSLRLFPHPRRATKSTGQLTFGR